MYTVDNLKQGAELLSEGYNLIEGGFSFRKVEDAQELLAGARTFFRGLTHREQADEQGMVQEDFGANWAADRQAGDRAVFMYSGCRDDQTSADATIGGSHVGAMSWAFLRAMEETESSQPSYIEVCRAWGLCRLVLTATRS